MNKEETINLLQSDYLSEKVYEAVMCSHEDQDGLLCLTLDKIVFYSEKLDDSSFFYSILLKELFSVEINKNKDSLYIIMHFYKSKDMTFVININNEVNYKYIDGSSENKPQMRKDFTKSLITYLLRQMKKSIKIDNLDYVWNGKI